ncbi:hypothetical protein J32TS6_21670 [Virgibacillus pantothenticus]|nr:hypothetical protein J32TS6_21670 [Virgibacillus pantothenticus]
MINVGVPNFPAILKKLYIGKSMESGSIFVTPLEEEWTIKTAKIAKALAICISSNDFFFKLFITITISMSLSLVIITNLFNFLS